MKKKLAAILIALLLFSSPIHVYAADVTTLTSVTISPIFSIEFYSDPTGYDAIRYDDGQIVFPLINPVSEESMVMTSAWVDGDNMSDVGIVCRTNMGNDWTLSVKANTTAPFEPTNLAIYKPASVYDRNLTGVTYTASGSDLWSVPTGGYETIFNSTGTDATNSAPFGILATFGFAVLPTGKATPTGQSEIGTGNILPADTYNFSIVYTLVTIS